MDFGKNLRAARELKGFTQERLSDQSGIAGIAHYENNNRKPSLDTMIALSDALGMPIDNIINSDKETVTITVWQWKTLLDKAGMFDKFADSVAKHGYALIKTKK